MSDNKDEMERAKYENDPEWRNAAIQWCICFFKLKMSDPKFSNYADLKRELEQARSKIIEVSNRLNNAKERTQEKK